MTHSVCPQSPIRLPVAAFYSCWIWQHVVHIILDANYFYKWRQCCKADSSSRLLVWFIAAQRQCEWQQLKKLVGVGFEESALWGGRAYTVHLHCWTSTKFSNDSPPWRHSPVSPDQPVVSVHKAFSLALIQRELLVCTIIDDQPFGSKREQLPTLMFIIFLISKHKIPQLLLNNRVNSTNTVKTILASKNFIRKYSLRALTPETHLNKVIMVVHEAGAQWKMVRLLAKVFTVWCIIQDVNYLFIWEPQHTCMLIHSTQPESEWEIWRCVESGHSDSILFLSCLLLSTPLVSENCDLKRYCF